jgi:uncharacterized protein (TIGR02246 family)
MALELLSSELMAAQLRQIWSNVRRRMGILGVSFFLAVPLSAKSVSSADAGRKNPDNRKLISVTVEKLVSAWNEKNSASMAGLFVPDAVLVMPSGNALRSRSAIRQRIISEWEGKLKDSTLSHSVERISFEGNDAATVTGRYRLNGVKILGFESAPEGTFILRHKRQQGRWMISKAELGATAPNKTST